LFLKRLVLRGFKSFADRAELDFEPGVMVVVGPNGSGKSNIVDSVAWVLGAQGARALRGGKMDDVIFAGTAHRPALGRAEVELTIDNSAGLLPIEFTEVTISRTLFRTGDSEYRINDVPCRLLDVQELLSDTGIGRQQHVIVGQGQLDAVLQSRPEDRRAIIEEAAGVLKFRKRREKAQRRLETTEGNLLRLNDLLREVRRQLRPLERQADAARRHDGLAAELRAIRLHLAGRELDRIEARLQRQRDERAAHGVAIAQLEARLRVLDDDVVTAERSLTGGSATDDTDVIARVEALRERARGLLALVAERRRGLARELLAVADEGVVETLVAEAEHVRRELEEVDGDFASLAPSRHEVEEAERRVGELRDRVERASSTPADASPEGRARLAAEHDLASADDALRASEAEHHRWHARAEALAQALDEARVVAGADVLAEVTGVVGALADLIEVEPGFEGAVGAALGEALRATVLSGDPRPAVTRIHDEGAAGLLVVLDRLPDDVEPVAVPFGARPVADFVRARRADLDRALRRLLAGVVVVDTWAEALEIAGPDVVAVTREGARLGGAGPWRIGPASAAITRRALDEAQAAIAGAAASVAAARTARDAALAAVQAARAAEHEAAERRRQERAELERLRAAAAKLRRDFEVRGAGIDERRSVLRRRLDEIEHRLRTRPDEHAAAAARQAALARREEAVGAVEDRLRARTGDIDSLAERWHRRQQARAEAARAAGERLDELRGERHEVERRLAESRELHARADVAEAESRLRAETTVDAIRRDFACEPDDARRAPEPELPEGTTAAARARELERELRLLGPVNPLALSEYEALQERHTFLEQQLDDVKTSRRELQRVIRAVDAEIVSVFEEAFADVARHFSDLFATLFPGGAGRLVLTDPADPLNTGIEIEARPSGKTPRRLSLLSGGERSLAALAFLFAVFRARPSPFYLLDEVEAALDDVNLHRFLDLIEEFRAEAQLLVVSHQKRTMEAADVLYGVSMPPGGSSRVVSQRVRDLQFEEI
jgi:chromosome segregation protein